MFPWGDYYRDVVVNVVGAGKLKRFGKKHAEVESSIRAWLFEAKEADWRTPADIKERYSSASILKDKIDQVNRLNDDDIIVIK